MKKLEIPKSTFIGGYYIKDDVCNAMKDLFFSHPQHVKPTKMKGDAKKCTEFGISARDNVFEPTYSYLAELNKCVEQYIVDFIPTHVTSLKWEMIENYNTQHYKKGEGFFKWHYERGADAEMNWRRSLVFMTYLNDVEDGGTEFLNQNCEVKARKGLTLVWPADWTHTHRGIISQTKEKTIITGWIKLWSEWAVKQ